MEKIRLSKLMSQRGICSRREADAFIERGLVYVDGAVVDTLGVKVSPDCDISLDPRARSAQTARVTILLNKPVGYVSGTPEHGYKAAVSLIRKDSLFEGDSSGIRFSANHLKGLAPAGRLDIDSQGLIVFTQDGRVAKKLVGKDSEIEKEYLVRVEGSLDEEGMNLLRHGLELDGKPLKPAHVSWQNPEQLKFILTEGKKRQIRRMCEGVGLTVVGLKRIRIGNVTLGDLPVGQWRYLGAGESF